MRHGEAAMTIPDAARELTAKGIQQVQQQANQLCLEGMIPSHIFVSPLKRAQQSAELMAQVLCPTVEVTTINSLKPNDSPAAVLTALDKQVEQDNREWDTGCLLLVSHLPLVAVLTSLLIEGHQRRSLTFMTADVIALETEVIAAGCCDLLKQFRV